MAKFWRVEFAKHGLFWFVVDGAKPIVRWEDGEKSRPSPYQRGWTISSIAKDNGPHRKALVKDRQPGEYHPRMWRPKCWPHTQNNFRDEWSSARLAAQNLFVGMNDVFRTVEPVRQNWQTFGHRIRELLILACTEVEAQCKAALRANGYTKRNGYWNITDYAELAKPMRLGEWQVKPLEYPHGTYFRPFASWRKKTPTSPPWYAAYNAVKHDREQSFRQATLGNLVQAMGAVFVLVYAQFGQFGCRRGAVPDLLTKNKARSIGYDA